MKKISLMVPIIEAISETDDSMNKHMNQMIKWAKYIERAIGSRRGYPFKTILVTVNGSYMDLPDDCYKPHALFYGDLTDTLALRYAEDGFRSIWVENLDDDEGIEYQWESLSYPNTKIMKWEEIGNKLSLWDEFTSTDLTFVYQYIETDLQGHWLVNDTHEEAIKRYLIYMISKKYMWKNFKSSKMTRNSDIAMMKEFERLYSVAVRNARALDSQESPLDTKG